MAYSKQVDQAYREALDFFGAAMTSHRGLCDSLRRALDKEVQSQKKREEAENFFSVFSDGQLAEMFAHAMADTNLPTMHDIAVEQKRRQEQHS